jgi:SpoVK/Ycf46/Vps4 family AAA+-type ATPase
LSVLINQVGAEDFFKALQKVTPAQQRSGGTRAKRVGDNIEPLVARPLREVLEMVATIIPSAWASRNKVLPVEDPHVAGRMVDVYRAKAPSASEQASLFGRNPYARPPPHSARLLIVGAVGMGQTAHICPGVLSALEKYPIHSLDLPALLADSASRTLEESCVITLREARRVTPSVLYLPRIDAWWGTVSAIVQTTISLLLAELPSASEVFVLASSNTPLDGCSESLRALFDQKTQCYTIPPTNPEEREVFFKKILDTSMLPPPMTPQKMKAGMRTRGKRKRDEQPPKVLPKQGFRRELSSDELSALGKEEEAILRPFRMYLRNVVESLMRDKKFKVFREEPDPEVVEDYRLIIKEPECLVGVQNKLNSGVFTSTDGFLASIEQIKNNAYEYNHDEGIGRGIRSKASDLYDTACHLIEEARHDHADLLKECSLITESRKRRKTQMSSKDGGGASTPFTSGGGSAAIVDSDSSEGGEDPLLSLSQPGALVEVADIAVDECAAECGSTDPVPTEVRAVVAPGYPVRIACFLIRLGGRSGKHVEVCTGVC